ncbi:probable cytochrome P450 6a13 isoform X2 [Phymastichus coffea]|uniref:probable cytochrome P450 6a13 isoform X2 n=1 Tax=Phymastichus coffea TaxID=108790 RepID=UPI00273C05AA|nr:probable cytochrome P450 6a13 isoform X2 [Phymastichus coffea]
MDIGISELLAGLGILFLYLYYRLTANFHFWEKYNVKGPKPMLIFGNFKDFILGRINIALLLKKYYDDYKSEPYVGIYDRSSPILILKDADLIKDVLIKDFNHFPDRGLLGKESQDPFSQNLLNLEYARWRPLRTNLSPVFSSGKLKDMFYLIAECAQNFENYISEIIIKGEPVECRELTAKYTTDAIGVCAFGLNMNALGDENSGFRKSGRDLMDNNFKNIARRMFREWFPRLYALIRPLVYNKAVDFFVDSLKETMEYRKKNNVRRNDFVDLLMDLKEQPKEKLNNIEMTDLLVTSQAFIFFLAGFETSSTTISNALYELALHPLYQDKLRQEIREVLAKDGKFTYDNIKTLKYLDKVVKETLRKYPPGSLLRRISVTPYTFAGNNLTIPKHTKIIIPVWAIHRDPDIWSDPDAFDPERFNDVNATTRHPMNYLPFGDGPHNCIGLRFANYQTKIGIATLINKFKVNVCDKTCIPYIVHPRAFIPTPVGGIHLKITTC